MKRKTVDEITTLTLLDGVAGCDEIDLPIGRLVRVEGDAASLFVVEAGDGCGGCALDPDVFEAPPFPCEAFACCDCDRRDETSVILRRVEGSDAVACCENERRDETDVILRRVESSADSDATDAASSNEETESPSK